MELKLYELTGNFLKAQEMLLDDEFDKEALENTLESIEMEIELKADGYAKMIKNLKCVQAGIKGQKDAIKEEINRLDSKEKAIENKIKYLNKELGNSMKVTGKERIKTDLFSFFFRKNQSTNILDEKMALESDFVKIEKKIDKAALLKAMKDGQNFDFAEIKESESLVIK